MRMYVYFNNPETYIEADCLFEINSEGAMVVGITFGSKTLTREDLVKVFGLEQVTRCEEHAMSHHRLTYKGIPA